MCKKIVCILISLSLALPAVLFAGALERYYVPQQMQEPAVQSEAPPRASYVREDVYDRFRAEIQGYDRDKKNKLEIHFRTQIKKAMREKNGEAVSHYERLIGILNSDK